MIEARPNAPQGSVTHLGYEWKLDDIRVEDVILCRNNAPLVALAFRLIRRSVPCNYLGRNLKDQLEQLIKKLKSDSPKGLIERLNSYERRETRRLCDKGKRLAAAAISDLCECLRTIVSSCTTLDAISKSIEQIFGTHGVTLSTIHKAKGLEWETVWLLNRSLIPSPYAESEASRRQEAHLLHVAITRAKLNLKYINT